MEKLSKEEVLHVARLARIAVSEDEIEKYQVSLKQLLDDVEKIKDINDISENVLVTPAFEGCKLRSDDDVDTTDFNKFKSNIPHSVGDFIEVPVMINE